MHIHLKVSSPIWDNFLKLHISIHVVNTDFCQETGKEQRPPVKVQRFIDSLRLPLRLYNNVGLLPPSLLTKKSHNDYSGERVLSLERKYLSVLG